MALSKAFVERAERLGIEHDEKYRNLNGMKMMFQNVAYVASNGDHGMSAASSAMRKGCRQHLCANLFAGSG